MSISRRGLIAAGLALASAGTVGVASTLTAGAAQIEPPPAVATTAEPAPAAATPTASPAASTAAASAPAGAERAARKPRTKVRRTPPSTLPWGAKPRTARKAGAADPAAEGVAASGAETPGEALEPVPAYEPKGLPAVGGVTGGLTTKGVKAAAGTTGITVQALAAPLPTPTVNYFYSSANQVGPTDGTYATLTVARPWLSKRDYHTLAEVAVRSLDGRQIVEVGWTVDRDVNNGSAEPHLFVYHWVDHQESCYNGCGFVQYSPNVKPGDVLPVGAAKRFAIQHFGSSWWIAYDDEWIGYFPDDLWKGTFTRGGLTQWFGEVASSVLGPCTDMGNGLDATSEDAAAFSEVNFLNGPQLKFTLTATSLFYSAEQADAKTFRFGGKGAC